MTRPTAIAAPMFEPENEPEPIGLELAWKNSKGYSLMTQSTSDDIQYQMLSEMAKSGEVAMAASIDKPVISQQFQDMTSEDVKRIRESIAPTAFVMSDAVHAIEHIIRAFKSGTSIADLAGHYRILIRDVEAVVRLGFRLK